MIDTILGHLPELISIAIGAAGVYALIRERLAILKTKVDHLEKSFEEVKKASGNQATALHEVAVALEGLKSAIKYLERQKV
jgi:hypothetical protein